MNWIDVAIVGIILLNIAIGWYKGLIRSVVNVISVVLAFIASKLYHVTVANLLNERFDLLNKIKLVISETFTNVNFSYNTALSTEETTQQLSGTPYLRSFMDKFFASDTFDQLTDKTTEGFSASFSDWAANHIINIMAMVTIFILVYIGVRIAGYLLAKLFDVPVLKGVNKLSGLLFGSIKGLFFAMLFVLGLVVISPFIENSSVITTLENSFLGMVMYQYNIILLIFQYFI